MTNSNLLKSKMAAAGDTNFVDALASLLRISRGTASRKLNGVTPFDQIEIGIIADRYDLSAEDIKEIFVVGAD